MKELQKTFIVLSAALAIEGLAQQTIAPDEAGTTPESDKAGKDKAKKKERVQKVRKARRRPADRDDDFAMPAGTLYDVLSMEDVR